MYKKSNKKKSRRHFLKRLCFLPPVLSNNLLYSSLNHKPYIKEAVYYNKLDNKIVECILCPNKCIIRHGDRGICRVRENQDGFLNTLVYGRLCSLNIDPVEKKPMFHFLPGNSALSVATAGCNLHCKFCQNWNIAQKKPEEIDFRYIAPTKLPQISKQYNSPIIAFTYNEPIVFYDYVYDTAKSAKIMDIKTVMISNGFINPEPLKKLCKVLDAIKIDFKAFSENFYKNITSGQLQPVLDTMKIIKEEKIWLEIVNLVVPTQNDSASEIEKMCNWILSNLGENIPVHFTKFHPQYLMKNLPPTPVKTLELAYNTAKNCGLNYVYVGNIPGHSAENTYCHNCGELLIDRIGYSIKIKNFQNGQCQSCKTKIPGVWS